MRENPPPGKQAGRIPETGTFLDAPKGADMKCYSARRDLERALKDSAEGGQSLFTHAWGLNIGPGCFRGAPVIGKLFDRDARRLEKTARCLGVRIVKIDHSGRPDQHVDLVGTPLNKAIALCRPTRSPTV
jgi:hypothetical protein